MVNKDRICYNPKCYKNEFLVCYNVPTDRPIVTIAHTCWYCHESKFLR